ncbi:DNA (cytosine-5-)-methyltransferase [Pontibacillus litoralis]|uniref:Cytosine-specific methyltransferase n=1 Tax=Pontibacillus litoralis JSM 072002 TaxID=1385512 RepID=A0A0A5G161_9BACI|nr:DNA (cytosine-5-)-methyltransferase [Pontibacillus litoralis]KGX85779.1 DNA-cytosine methyltransferase [Pontibacillus litoralis JSM 072002]
MTTKNDYKYTVSSLFAGVGGIDKGFEQAGAEVIWANEMDKNACITYRENFNHSLLEDDVRNVHEFLMPDTDILTAGWPCVAFSVAGQRHGMKYTCSDCGHEHMVTYEQYVQGATCPECGGNTEAIDPRGTLFYDVVRFIRAKKPKAFFLENVKNLHGHDKGRTFKVIEEMLRESGYHFESRIYNTMEYGNIPQNRERVFIVGFSNKKALQKFEWPEKLPLTNTIDDVLDRNEKQDEKYYYRDSSQYYPMLSETMQRKDTVYQLRRVYVRENQSNVCPTLTANMGGGGHNVPLILDDWGIRKLTPKETFRFQGFPVDDDYSLPEDMANSHLYMQAGNAVSVPVIKRIAEKQLDALEKVYKKNTKNKKENEEMTTV